MGSLARKVSREKMKQQYKKFKSAWRNEKAYQRWTKETDQPNVIKEENVPELGRCPTFSMWCNAVENQKNVVQPEENKKEEKIDLAWEDDGIPTLE